MIIRSAEFIISAVGPKQYPEGNQPEIALAGRSNVGKSSLINKMINRKNLARTSSTPGKTQTLNFYHINESFYFVDLPGYGFAKVPKPVQAQWSKFIEQYLSKRDCLKAVLQLVDLRHPPSKEDIHMFEWLGHFGIPRIVVTTKADKISRGHWPKHQKVIRQALQLPKNVPMVLFSSETGQGKDELWGLLAPYLVGEDTETESMPQA
ncbi:ribosome biogenesis GTP-binding protein YihA/YsxC [Effusibacillus dendaii]|uniref:Probable GTP-binding protein EngB n=1 Tax=Effusibacillus dendaii TaxID=2743772 RepID=A0A7I8DIN6_9BACL|nr:ribosome biogenesis GTP-binding protein YihA/YsxC [Effusibacillus dendaii]BCJ88520.1 putative GTP-binding protein EngB [Effusibacillus dendaii]